LGGRRQELEGGWEKLDTAYAGGVESFTVREGENYGGEGKWDNTQIAGDRAISNGEHRRVKDRRRKDKKRTESN